MQAFSFEDQLAFLNECVVRYDQDQVRRMMLSLAESVKAARDHQDCLNERNLQRK
jgi:hypothetical protein